MSSRRHLIVILTAIFTLALIAWAIVEIIRHGITLWTSAVLVYLALVSLTLWLSRSDAAKNISTSPAAALPMDSQISPVRKEEIGEPEKTAQEIILNAIRTKGKAKRHDLLPLVKISKSTLVRLLDKMEAEGLVVQVGERKAAFYALPGPKQGTKSP
jgi:hypothetical protein